MGGLTFSIMACGTIGRNMEETVYGEGSRGRRAFREMGRGSLKVV